MFLTRARRPIALFVASGSMLLCGAARAEDRFQGALDPLPFDNANKPNVVGSGTLSATLTGARLRVTGSFSGLSSPARAAHLEMGLAEGVKGVPIAELVVAPRMEGGISGTVTLTAAQLRALRGAALYIQIDSIKAPDGNLWGWLEKAD